MEQGTLDSLAKARRAVERAYAAYEEGKKDEFLRQCNRAIREITEAIDIDRGPTG